MYKMLILGSQQHPICHLLKLFPWLLWGGENYIIYIQYENSRLACYRGYGGVKNSRTLV